MGKLNKFDKHLFMFSKRSSEIIEPFVFGGLGGFAFWLLLNNPIVWVGILLIAIILWIISIYIKRKYTEKCPGCGRFK